MKHIHITVEDWEAEALEKIKGDLSWHDLLITATGVKPKEDKKK